MCKQVRTQPWMVRFPHKSSLGCAISISCYDLEIFYVSELFLYLISLLWCADMFVFQVGVASVNQLEVVIGPSMHLFQI